MRVLIFLLEGEKVQQFTVSAVTEQPQIPLDRESFGIRLLELRVAAGLSQKGVAERSGGAFSQPNYSQWESGKGLPSALMIPALAASLGCTIDDLYTDPTTKPVRPLPGRPRKSPDESADE